MDSKTFFIVLISFLCLASGLNMAAELTVIADADESLTKVIYCNGTGLYLVNIGSQTNGVLGGTQLTGINLSKGILGVTLTENNVWVLFKNGTLRKYHLNGSELIFENIQINNVTLFDADKKYVVYWDGTNLMIKNVTIQIQIPFKNLVLLKISEDKKYILAVINDTKGYKAEIYNLRDLKSREIKLGDKKPISIAGSGKYLIVAYPNSIEMYNITTRKKITEKTTEGRIFGAFIDKNSGHILLVFENMTYMKVPIDEIIKRPTQETQQKIPKEARLVNETISNVDEIVKELKELGANVSDAEKLLKESKKAYERGDYKTANETATQALKEVEKIVQEEISNAQNTIDDATSKINKLKLTINQTYLTTPISRLNNASQTLTNAKNGFKARNYIDAFKLAKEAKNLANQALNEAKNAELKYKSYVEELLKKVNQTISNATTTINRISKETNKGAKLDDAISKLSEAKAKLIEAQQEFAKGNYLKAEKLANEAKALAEKARKSAEKAFEEWKRKQQLKKIAIVVVIVIIAIAGYFAFKKVKEEKEYREAKKAVRDMIDALKHVEKELDKIGALEYEEIRNTIKEIKRMIERARNYLNIQDYDSIYDIQASVGKKIDELYNTIIEPYKQTQQKDISKHVYYESYIGRRENNEDSAFADKIDGNIVLAVADGMGGHLAGEVASQKAIEILTETVKKSPFKDPKRLFEEAIKKANRVIYEMGHDPQHPERYNMGTTLTAAIIRGDKATIANVGDSRTYLITSRGEITQLTKDHSLVQELIDKGVITKEQAKSHPQKNIITKALGVNLDIKIDPEDIKEIKLNKGDYLLLCSDGLSDVLDDDVIAKTIVNSKDLKEAVKMLIEKAYSLGSDDNITVVLYKH